MKIGFIGLGIMGRPMALNLRAAGHELVVPERRTLTQEVRAAATKPVIRLSVVRSTRLTCCAWMRSCSVLKKRRRFIWPASNSPE